MNIRRTAMIVYVNLDAREGVLHTGESTKDVIQVALVNRMSHYKPVVSLLFDDDVPVNLSRTRRNAYLVEVDLSPTPGVMHTQESAQNTIRNIIFQRVPEYKPIVSLAPQNLQPMYAN